MLKFILSTFCVSLALANRLPLRPRDGYKVPTTSFNSQTDFNTYWNYNYPWGDTHNGAARMDSAHVAIGNGQLTLTTDYVTGQAATSSGIAINHLSGTVYAKEYLHSCCRRRLLLHWPIPGSHSKGDMASVLAHGCELVAS
jgi:hypothetical protein